jgi:hypothetical protein
LKKYEDYIAERGNDLGIRYAVPALRPTAIFENEANNFTRAYFIMVEFSMAMRLSDSDREIMKSILVVVEECLLISQDYWSYDKEYQQWKSHGTPIFSAIHFFSQKEGLKIDEAREKVKNRILKLEVEYCHQKNVFYGELPEETIHLKRLIETLGVTIGGLNYWATKSPRYHSWKQSASLTPGDSWEEVDDSVTSSNEDLGTA